MFRVLCFGYRVEESGGFNNHGIGKWKLPEYQAFRAWGQLDFLSRLIVGIAGASIWQKGLLVYLRSPPDRLKWGLWFRETLHPKP